METIDNATAVDWQWIASDDQLASLCEEWLDLPRIALDTEFMRVRTFFPHVALYQINDGRALWLLDPLAVDCRPLAAVLAAERPHKIMHSCSEDVEAIAHHLDVSLNGVLDTQLANALVSRDFSLGYQALVSQELDVQLEKSETRSDWLRRPLTDAQCHYAADDVRHLLYLYDVLAARLEQAGRTAWLAEESATLVASSIPPQPNEYYRNVKEAWRLNDRAVAALKLLVQWRERTARRQDRPRGHVMEDAVLLEIAERAPTTQKALSSLLRGSQLKRYGEVLLGLVKESLAMQKTPRRPERPLTRRQEKLLKTMRAVARERAEGLGVADAITGRRRDLESLIRWADGVAGGEPADPGAEPAATGDRLPLPPIWRGWREAAVLPSLRPLLPASSPSIGDGA